MEHPIVQVSHLDKYYGLKRALFDVTFSIPQGTIVGLFGPNGCGKTTLIKILVGLLRQYQGEVYIDGSPIGPETKAKVSYLPDRNVLNPRMKVTQSVRYFKDFFADFNEEKAYEILKEFQIPTDQIIKSLSKGMIEKVHFALMLARDSRLYIFDEPIAGVDPLARDQIFSLMAKYIPMHSSVLVATHLVSDIQGALDEAIFLNQGVIVDHRRAEDFLSEYASLEEAYKGILGKRGKGDE